ncbi:MAG: hypothetical protein GC154_09920 [bacterium]|nr:hypothetical protein [bacterium]
MMKRIAPLALTVFVTLFAIGCGDSGSSDHQSALDIKFETPTQRPTETPLPAATATPAPPTATPTPAPVAMPPLVQSLTPSAPAQEGPTFDWLKQTMYMMNLDQLNDYGKKIYGLQIGGWSGEVTEIRDMNDGQKALQIEMDGGDRVRPYVLLLNISPELVSTFSVGDRFIFAGKIKAAGAYEDFVRVIAVNASELYKNPNPEAVPTPEAGQGQ